MTENSNRELALRVVGVIAMLAGLCCAVVFVVGVLGVAMCTDGHTETFCRTVDHSYVRMGIVAAAAFGFGLTAVIRARSLTRYTALVAVVGVALIVGVGLCTSLFLDLAA